MTIKEIKAILSEPVLEETIRELSLDSRKGVKTALSTYFNRLEKEEEIHRRTCTLYEPMRCIIEEGFTLPCGIDEAGRGPLAGPVVAACVILPPEPLLPVFDSKKLSEKQRDELFEEIQTHAIGIGTGIVDAGHIDRLNIYRATQLAMITAWENCNPQPDYCFIDAMEIKIPVPQKSMIKGDARCASISGASIIAKVTRDRIMKEAAITYPQYGFESHKGYGSAFHIDALEKHGPCPIHRTSFSPVSDFILPTREWFEILLKRCTSIEALRNAGLKIKSHKNDLLDSELDELRETYTECFTELSHRKHDH